MYADSIDSKFSFNIDYTGELQSDFKHSKFASLLQLSTNVRLSSRFTFDLSSVSFVTTDENLLNEDLMGYSNIDASNLPFALAVAGFTWNICPHHSLFAGIRRIDEDYFCSDGLALFVNSGCGGFHTLTANYDIAAYPMAAVGIHYSYDIDSFGFQSSLYNGQGHNSFYGRDNVFRVCPASDGVHLMAQGEYRYDDSRYFLGGSLHYGKQVTSEKKCMSPTLWAYAEQSVTDKLLLIGVYSRDFDRHSVCRNYAGIGCRYSFSRADVGLFSHYARIEGRDEWSTEFTSDIPCNRYFSVQPVLHLIRIEGQMDCIGMFRLNVHI
ncbi:MAG: hypothetical protein ACI4B5_09675 [Bacteroidaceae bacterium]